ncbi:MAG: hypothetical protein RL650_1594 [Pseudomonadota bacterium]
MKKNLTCFLYWSLLCASAVQANDASCYSIQSPDKKNVCLAMSKKQNSYCYSENMCLANVLGQQSYCYSIKANDMKHQCLAQVK